MAFDALVYKTVTIVPASGHGATIMLLQMSTMNANRDQLDQQMRQAFERQFQTASGVWKVAGERTVTIKGKPATLTISEIGSTRTVMRQAQEVFTGKSGLVMISIYGGADSWDWNMLDAFFQSIR